MFLLSRPHDTSKGYTCTVSPEVDPIVFKRVQRHVRDGAFIIVLLVGFTKDACFDINVSDVIVLTYIWMLIQCCCMNNLIWSAIGQNWA